MVTSAAPTSAATHRRPPTVDLVLLAVAVAAVSTSAPLIRQAAAPALAIAFWRNALALPLVGGWVAVRAAERAAWRARTDVDRRRSRLAGLLLALHFAAWVPSLSFTTVASSVALVATQPVWAALIARRTRRGCPLGHLARDRPGAGGGGRPHRGRPVDLGPRALR